ncbi:hypothetical protein FPZ12_029605 [Amycolatopsis acidicola]|uniref:Uncharacterized protein n=1 Tax=Amycolatopsis acidicola TaxID=2596893 RepID=A0A5N0UV98_9PSEU|nr:hypothetical protein [Amycolatopsis acidicola]KAA9155554.1 hypothetical protein FPZ12_029605 [Amycolatopsis acidicola]
MFTTGDPAKDAALSEALAASERELSHHVYFDWDNDGQFANQYSDLSSVLSENDINLEDAALATDQPEDINAIQGYSSSELKLVLSGQRYSDEAPMEQVLSRFNINGPFFNRDLNGVLVKYDIRVQTSLGPIDVRQFTGWVTDLQIAHSSGDVSVTCNNNVPWNSRLVTLPLWACDKYADASVVAGVGANNGNPARPINSSWIVGEVLRQAGTPIGPAEREDCILSLSGMGSLLPSIGEKYHEVTATIDRHQLTSDSIDLMSKESTKYGPALTRVSGTPTPSATQTRHPHQNWFKTDRTRGWATVPRNGSTDAARNIGFSLWSLGNGSTTNVGLPTGYAWADSGQIMVLGLNSGGMASGSTFSIMVQVLANGQVFVKVLTNTGSTLGQWGWKNQTSGWHYYDVNLRFTSSSVQCVLTVDGVAQGSPTYGANATAGFTYMASAHPTLNTRTPDDYSNPGFVLQYDPAQHYQIYWGDSSAVYRTNQGVQPTGPDGKPWANFQWCLSEMSFIPDTANMTGWEILQRVVTAEFGTLRINEFAQVDYEPHYVILNNSSLQPQASYTVDNVLDLVTNPSLDQMRNSITISYEDRYQNLDDVWTNDSPYDFYTPGDGLTHVFPTVYPLTDVVSVITFVAGISGWQDAEGSGEGSNYQQSNLSRVTGVVATDQGKDYYDPNHTPADLTDNNFMNAWVVPTADQRGLQVATYCLVNSSACYYGAKVNIQDFGTTSATAKVPTTSFKIKGKRIGDTKTGTYTLSNSASVAESGTRQLTIEPYEWRQTKATAQAIVQALLADTVTPAPTITGLKIPNDPRLRVTDVISVQPGEYYSGPLICQIMGRSVSGSNGEDTLDARIVRSPSKWTLGVTGASELGVTTVLN